MKTQIALATATMALLAAPRVFPCGAPFGNGISVNPQQDIIVAYKNGVETYVFQPTFCGTASNFGLILPVPATLTAPPALSDQQVFYTVDSISRPKIVTVTSCYGRSAGSGGSTGSGPPKPSVDAGTTVVSSGHVGFLDWAQLKADTVASFTDWLTANGYPYSTSASSVFTYYVQKGWYFVAFKISRAVVDAGSATVCSALGPVKLSFATPEPIVPSRMASAATAPTGSYANAFSWRIFGLTPGDQQLGFSSGANGNRVLGYSGAVTAGDLSSLAGLAQLGDRLTKLTLTFTYGSTDPDVGLTLITASDYRETQYSYAYVQCTDAGAVPVDVAHPVLKDAALSPDMQPQPGVVDAATVVDLGVIADDGPPPVFVFDAQLVSGPDAGIQPIADAGLQPIADARISLDTHPYFVPDVAPKSDAPPVLAGGKDAAPPSGSSNRSSGCSVAADSTSGGYFALASVGLLIAARLRKRRAS
jgi:MYXO-CTERM domain-containing protein